MAKASEELKNRILCYINSYTEQHGFAPSYREIQASTILWIVTVVLPNNWSGTRNSGGSISKRLFPC